MSQKPTNPTQPRPSQPAGFMEDFRRFFLRGLATLLPTLITLIILAWIWNFLSQTVGSYIGPNVVYGLQWLLGQSEMGRAFGTWYGDVSRPWHRDLVNVVSAIVLVYLVGVLVGNFIGRTAYRLTEMAVIKLPVIRAIYPAAKQVTDFLMADRKGGQFAGSRVVAVQPHEGGIWSIGLVTGSDFRPLSQVVGEEMVTVFTPSSPTAFSGYVLVVPRRQIVELPMTVEEAMRLLVSGGVIGPQRLAEPSGQGEEAGAAPRRAG